MPQVTDDRIRAAVARVLSEKGMTPASLAKTGKTKKATGKATMDAQTAFAQLLDMSGDAEERWQLMGKLRKAGLLDDVIAKLEAHAKNSPNDANAHCALANAYAEKINEATSIGDQAMIGGKIEANYQKALKINPEHWEARFSRAIGMTFWPSFMGGKTKAIKQFEILIGQQEKRSPQPEFAETYVMLGNIYSEQGKTDQAHKIWAQGAKLHPQNDKLQKALKR